MGLFRRRRSEKSDAPFVDPTPTPPDLVDPTGQELAALRVRMEAFEAAAHDLGGQVRGLQARFTAPLTSEPAPTLRTVEQADVDRVRAQLFRMGERLEALDARITSVASSIATLDARLSTVSSELANQITELGSEIDALASSPPAEPMSPPPAGPPPVAAIDPAIDPEVLEALRDGQVRLANEQARYQIAFRQELAELVERLRRPGA